MYGNQVVNGIDMASRKITRSKRDLRNHNLFYDALHYVFGLDNGAYDAIDFLVEDQAKNAERLKQQKGEVVSLSDNVNRRLMNVTAAYEENFHKISYAINGAQKEGRVLAAIESLKEVLAELERKYDNIMTGSHESMESLKKEAGVQLSRHSRHFSRWEGADLVSVTEYVVFGAKTQKSYSLHYVPQQGPDGWVVIDHYASVLAIGEASYELMTQQEWSSYIQEEEDLFIMSASIFRQAEYVGMCL